jgi:choline dehydrogenase
MLTSIVAEAGLFTTLGAGSVPNLQFHVAPVLFEDHGFRAPTEHGFSMGPTLVRPRSRGRVSIRSADPMQAPAVDPNYLSLGDDVATLVGGLRLAREIAEQPAYRALRGEELAPGPAVRSDAALEAYVRHTCETLYHPVGTCRMGADDEAVVDPQLRVRGVRALRVADASVMPVVPNGNTNAPAIMIGEKAVDLLRAGKTERDTKSDERLVMRQG